MKSCAIFSSVGRPASLSCACRDSASHINCNSSSEVGSATGGGRCTGKQSGNQGKMHADNVRIQHRVPKGRGAMNFFRGPLFVNVLLLLIVTEWKGKLIRRKRRNADSFQLLSPAPAGNHWFEVLNRNPTSDKGRKKGCKQASAESSTP